MSALPWPSDCDSLGKLAVSLINNKNLSVTAYVLAVVQTDLAELGYAPTGREQACPGQPPPEGWHVYAAALRWCAVASRSR